MMRLAPFVLAVLLAGCGAPAETAAPASSSSSPASSPAPAPAPQGSVRTIDVATLAQELPQAAIVVDVRTPAEFAGGHVPGAVNIPVSDIEARAKELEPHRGAPVYLICKSGGRSRAASKTLSGLGFDVVDVGGGTMAWVAAGNPTE